MTEEKKDGLATRANDRVEARDKLSQMLVKHDSAGNTQLVIPAELSAHYNVLAPTAVLTQRASNFVPGFTAVTLELGAIDNRGVCTGGDFYSVDRSAVKKREAGLAISKVGLRKLQDAGAVRFGGPGEGGKEIGEPVPVEFTFGELTKKMPSVRAFVYTAVGLVRRADGTLIPYVSENEWNPAMAAMEVESAVLSSQYLKNDGERMKKATDEFARAFKFRRPMAKSKAQNAVIRDAMRIKAKYTADEAGKPFFIVSYDFTADTSDPNALALMQAMYGVDSPHEALYAAPAEAAPMMSEVPEDAIMPEGIVGDEDVTDADYEVIDDEDSEPALSEDELATLQSLDKYAMPVSDMRGKTLSTIWSERGRKWFVEADQWAAANTPLDPRYVDPFSNIAQYLDLRTRAEGGAE